jgi:sigma-B regulation protein RsbU (phosphoserine phosphatase)
MQSSTLLDEQKSDWQNRLALNVEMMREISRQTDPQALVQAYAARMRRLLPIDQMIWLSRRELEPPRYRITRNTSWHDQVNPWKEKERLPVLEGGLLGELIYSDAPRIIDDLQVDDHDPGREYLAGQKSLIAIPNYDQGVALNMTVLMRAEPYAFSDDQLPELVSMGNLFGRATHYLVLSDQLRQEMNTIGEIQRSLLPAEFPTIPGMDLAAYYQTSRSAGGDYYDFFPLPDGKWGILIADVSGHGAPAAVIMAVTHSVFHAYPEPLASPARVLGYVNNRLARRYTAYSGTFVTAFYGVYDPASRRVCYANAGHNPPRVKHCPGSKVTVLDGARRPPLGVSAAEQFEEAEYTLQPGDQFVLYTDGITEARNPAGRMFGLERLDCALRGCRDNAADLIGAVMSAVEIFAAGRSADDDRTLLVAKIS